MSADLPSVDLTATSAFVAAMKFDVTEASGSRVAGTVDLGPDQHTPWGVVHGGVYCSVVESAASIGASLAVGDRGQFAVVAEPIQQGRTLQLWQVVLTRAEDGKLVARGQVRLQNVSLPAPS